MDNNQLMTLFPEMVIFVRVVEAGSFSQAAKNLGKAPSSISRSITRLENLLEQKLLERTTRQMALSSAGEEIYARCREMLAAAQLAVAAAESDKTGPSGLLRVAAPKALARQMLMPMVLDFMQAYPKIELQLKVEDYYIDPISDAIDVIIHITEHPVPGLVGKVLGHSRWVMCATPRYLARHGTPQQPQDLTQHHCITLGENPRDKRWTFTKETTEITVNVSGQLSVNHSEIRRAAVLRDMGISVFPEFAIAQSLHSRAVIAPFPAWHISGNDQGQILTQYAQSKYIPAQIKTFY